LRPDGTLDADDHEHEIPFAGVPSQIPLFDGERVVLLREATHADMLTAEPTFDALRPEISVKKQLGQKETQDLLVTMGKTAAKGLRLRRRRRRR
jgi:hypothetical protein